MGYEDQQLDIMKTDGWEMRTCTNLGMDDKANKINC